MKDRLRGVRLFEELGEDALDKIAAIVGIERFEDGDEVFDEGSPGDALYVILDGIAVVRKLIDPDEMRYKTLSRLGPGNYFGEMALFDGLPRSAGITAQGGLELARIGREDFQRLMNTDPAAASRLSAAVISTLSARLRQTNDELVTVFETGKIIGDVRDLDEMVRKLTDRIVRVLKADGGIFLIYNEFTDEFDAACSTGVDFEALSAAVFDGDEPLVAWMRSRRGSLVAPERARSPIPLDPPAPYSAGSIIATPLIHGNQLLGIMVFTRAEGRQGFTDEDENMVFAVATQSAAAIESAKHRREEDDRQRLNRKFIGR